MNLFRVARQAIVGLALSGTFGTVFAAPAHAHRPFDLTDADVLSAGRVQVKLGPVNVQSDEAMAARMAPGVSLSVGLAPGWELTAGGKVAVALDGSLSTARIGDLELAAKALLREGSLQGREGPSLGAEVAALLPGLAGADPGAGAAVLGVASWQLGSGLAHAGALADLGRDGQLGAKTSLILEGPEVWSVRPVAEGGLQTRLGAWNGSALAGSADSAPVVFGLVGVVWKLSGDLSLDAGLRLAASGTARSATMRSGLSWKLP